MSESIQDTAKVVSPQIQETFSYSWYPTQCEIGSTTAEQAAHSKQNETASSDSGHESFHMLKTENEEELIVVEQVAPTQPAQGNERVVGSKFSEQQSRILMHAWKELYDRRQHVPSNIHDWREIAYRVNLAPGSFKTVQQVKKKFKNLRDRYRAAKAKNKRRGLDVIKLNSIYAEFEKVYGCEEDRITARQARTNSNEKKLRSSTNSIEQTGIGLPTIVSTPSIQVAPMSASKVTPRNSSSSFITTSSESNHVDQEEILSTGFGQVKETRNDEKIKTTGQRDQTDLQLVNAVRELQQQQIIMQRELTKSMKQMEERILSEVSAKVKESEDRFRQQIANALTQLGNLIRIA